MREQFIAKGGMTFRSQNDGETYVHAVERYIHRGYEFIDSIRLDYGNLEGDYAFVIGRANDDKLYAFKKGSGMVIVIDEDDARLCANGDDLIVLPKSDPQISALLGVLPLQLLSYHMSVMRGFGPDFPWNLSKTLTVD